MSLAGDILSVFLTDYHTSRKLIWKKIHGIPGREYSSAELIRKAKIEKGSSFRATMCRLKQKGFVKGTGDKWRITESGFNFSKQDQSPKKFPKHSRQKLDGQKNLIVSFDIPEEFKSGRNWLRQELFGLGFTMLQKSVWWGPGPLPKGFIEAIEELDLLKYIKFFEANEFDVV